jgi:predicted membrane chloride channel (bestrophin family)
LLGIEEIARIIENPFGLEQADLPLEDFCAQIEGDTERLLTGIRQVIQDNPGIQSFNRPINK